MNYFNWLPWQEIIKRTMEESVEIFLYRIISQNNLVQDS